MCSSYYPSAYHSDWLGNTRAKFDLNWRPRTDLAKLIDTATDCPISIHR